MNNNDLDPQFIAGEDVTEELTPPRRDSGMVVSVRLERGDAEKLVEMAEESGHTVSQIARQAIRGYLAFGGRKILAQSISVVSMKKIMGGAGSITS